MKRRHRTVVLALLSGTAALWYPTFGTPGSTTAFAVIAAPGSAPQHLTPRVAALIYRRKQTYWEDGARVQPVNLPAANALRQAFSQCILGETPNAMENYWREMYYHGVLPPHVVDSEQAVVLFVASTPGAIGYVSACPKDIDVNVMFTVGDVPNCPHRAASCESLQGS